MAKTNLGPVALKPKGAYSNTAAYTRLDVVDAFGGSYAALKGQTGVPPVEDTTDGNWQCLVKRGAQGNPGVAATVSVGTVSMAEAGTPAKVENKGTGDRAVLDFTIPKGDRGLSATISIGAVTTGSPGSQAAVKNVGDSNAAVFEFTIPEGEKGADGDVSFEALTDEQREALKGKSAYASALAGGYHGTETDFYADLAATQALAAELAAI